MGPTIVPPSSQTVIADIPTTTQPLEDIPTESQSQLQKETQPQSQKTVGTCISCGEDIYEGELINCSKPGCLRVMHKGKCESYFGEPAKAYCPLCPHEIPKK